jgi:CHAD domain-containing protein
VLDASNSVGEGAHADRPLGRVVAKRIERLHRQLVDMGSAGATAGQIHEQRKQAKKLRYMFECFEPLMPRRRSKPFTRRLKAIQQVLGDHQDAVVHTDLVHEASRVVHQRGASAETMLAAGQLVHVLDQRRRVALLAFAEQFDAYDSKSTRRALDAVLDHLSP